MKQPLTMKLYRMLAVLTIITLVNIAGVQNVFAQENTNGTDINAIHSKGLAVTNDNDGNFYVTGYIDHNAAGNDILVIKYNSNGDTVWVRTYNGSGNSDDRGLGIVCDNSGDVYITGVVTVPNRAHDIVLLRYTPAGVLKFAVTYSGSNGNYDDEGTKITVDNSKFIYVTGYTSDNNGVPGIITLKYDNKGNVKWAARETNSGSSDSRGLGIVVDNSNHICITGYTKSTSGKDIIVLRYNPAGIKDWDKIYNGKASGDDVPTGIAVDGSNNIYISGYVLASQNFDNTDCALLKYNSSGELQWIKTYNGPGNSADQALGIVVDNADFIYITGFTISVNGDKDYLTIKYNSAGQVLWTKIYNGTGNGDDCANAIALITNNNAATGVIVTGGSWGLNNNHDYTTVKYSTSNGNQQQVTRYSISRSSDDIALGIAVDESNILVTGYSGSEASSMDNSIITTESIPNGEEMTRNNETPAADEHISLGTNYPNPFNPSTMINFNIKENSQVKLVVYDMTGKVVSILADSYMNAGSYNVRFDASGLSSGVYFYELISGNFKDIKKMTLIK